MSDNKIENCTLNRNWIWNGKEYLDIITWNAAIEAAAKIVDDCNKEGPYNAIAAAPRIRELKK